MGILKDLANQVSKNERLIENMMIQVAKSIKHVNNVRLGIIFETSDIEHDLSGGVDTSQNVQVKKGDIILSVANNTAMVATGEFSDDEKPIVVAQNGARSTIEPELVIIGNQSYSPVIKQLVARIAQKYPDRRILAYGSLAAKR